MLKLMDKNTFSTLLATFFKLIILTYGYFRIYLESGQSFRLTKQASVGDVMSFHLDMDTNKGFFRKNGEKCIELNLNPAVFGYYPCIAMNSIGEAVQIMEKSCWEPDSSAKVS